uniref:Uncharacterized protein n=1 Tax=Parascaris equorum TaxID=6256 RepID=A0A914RBR6_PAREQ
MSIGPHDKVQLFRSTSCGYTRISCTGSSTKEYRTNTIIGYLGSWYNVSFAFMWTTSNNATGG